MVDLDELARRARRAAEWGRLRRASRVILTVAPFTLVAAAISPQRGVVLCVGMVLLAATIGLGCLNAAGARAAQSGLKAGALPMALALFTGAVEGWCEPGGTLSLCAASCLLAGLGAGGVCAWQVARGGGQRPLAVLGATALVASLTIALGCVGLGLANALAVLVAMTAGAIGSWLPARART